MNNCLSTDLPGFQAALLAVQIMVECGNLPGQVLTNTSLVATSVVGVEGFRF